MKSRDCVQIKGPARIRWLALMLLCPAMAWSLGMGDITVKSALNEPLEAEIELLYSDETEVESVVVSLASDEDYNRIGLTKARIGAPILLNVIKNDRDRFVIAVTTPAAINSPIVEILVEANWANGRLLREYVMLLDPPVSNVTRQPQVGTIAPPASTTRPQPVTETPGTSNQTPTPTAVPEVYSATSGDSYGPVTSGDTLWGIASGMATGTDVSVNQMMVALYEANPDAFFDDNINALKRGAILRLPERDRIQSVTSDSATSVVRQQNQNWSGNVQRSAPTVSQAGVDSQYTDSGSRDSGDSENSRVELVPPSGNNDSGFERRGSSGSSADMDELRTELARAEERVISTELENEELRSRVTELEDLSDNFERAISLKEADLADLQNQLGQLRRQLADSQNSNSTLAEPVVDSSFNGSAFNDDDALADSTETDNDFFTSFEGDSTSAANEDFLDPVDTSATDSLFDDSSADVMANNDTPASDTENDSWLTSGSEIDSTNDSATSSQAPTAGSEPATSPTASTSAGTPEPGMMDKILNGLKSPMIAGPIVAVLLLIAGLFIWRRRKSSDDDSVEDLMGDLGGSDEFAEDRETELLTDIEKNPDNPQVHLSLMRYYYSNRDTNSYVSAVERMRESITDDSHPAWAEIKSMGRDLAPGLSLFAYDDEINGASALEESTSTVSDDLGFDLSDLDGNDAMPSSDIDLGDITGGPADLDFDTDSLSLEDAVDSIEESAERAVDGHQNDAQDLASELREEAEDIALSLDDDADLSLSLDDIDLGSDGNIDLSMDIADTTGFAESDSDDDIGIDLDLGDLGGPDEELELDLSLDIGQDNKDEPTEFELQAVSGNGIEPVDAISLEPDTEELEIVQEQFDAEAETLAELAAVTDADLDDLGLDSLDIEDDSEDQSSTDTKLDLAKAYMEMGDPEGASSMLHEVKAEGNPAQQEEAERLLNDMGD